MKIIGHRGAAGLALENTKRSLEIASKYDLAAIEFDVRHTKDGVLVLNHDANLRYMAGVNKKLSDLTFKQVQKITLKDGSSHIISLKEALETLKGQSVIIECKDSGCIEKIQSLIADYPGVDIAVAARNLDELAHMRSLNPDIKLYAIEHFNPMEVINHARTYKLNGMGLNFWLLNPLTYLVAKQAGIEIFVYTLNNRAIARWLLFLYPDISICTNHPERFVGKKRPFKAAFGRTATTKPPSPKTVAK